MGWVDPLLRGGSWNNNPRNCRSANRNRNNADNRNNNFGFRVACSHPSTLRCQSW
ncbi:MAG: SUMF1/EgtB/PvdO family nonheme iron enzyme [Cyanobacteria bacterium P01_F01_bin.150]